MEQFLSDVFEFLSSLEENMSAPRYVYNAETDSLSCTHMIRIKYFLLSEFNTMLTFKEQGGSVAFSILFNDSNQEGIDTSYLSISRVNTSTNTTDTMYIEYIWEEESLTSVSVELNGDCNIIDISKCDFLSFFHKNILDSINRFIHYSFDQ